MIVLLHPQGFTDTSRGKTKIQSSFCHSQAVSQLESGRVRQYRCNSEDEKHIPSPAAMEGLQIVLRATFKIDDSEQFLLLHLKELIQKNYKPLDQSPQSPTE